MDVDDPGRGPVELRVLFGGVDEVGDAGGGVVDLVHQQLGLHRVVEPADGSGEDVVVHGRRDLLQPVHVQPGLDEGRCDPPSLRDPVVVEPVGELVLPVGGLQGAERRRLRDAFHRALLHLDEIGDRLAGVVALGDDGELVPHLADAFAQGRRGPDGRRGRVVELVGETGGQRSEGQQPFPLPDGPLGVLRAEEQPLQQVRGHREPLLHEVRERLRGQHEEPGRLGHPHGVGVRLGHPVAEVGLHGPRVHTALRGPAHLDVVAADPARQYDGALDHHVEAGGRVALGVHGTGVEALHAALGAQLPELLRRELLEQEQRGDLLRVAVHELPAHDCSR